MTNEELVRALRDAAYPLGDPRDCPTLKKRQTAATAMRLAANRLERLNKEREVYSR